MERYESLGLVGQGSYGAVLKCRHRDSGRLVAIKKFVDSDEDKTVKKIAQREVRLLRQLRHSNLVNLLEVWKRRRRWYLVFEFVERTLLDDLEQNPGGLDLNTCRQNLFQILRAVAFCHRQNIIHRDIKPENVLISQGGVVKLCDFGFARSLAAPADGEVYTDYVATRWYRAPELLVGDVKYGKPVDVWAVGCLFLEMLTGQPFFPGDSDLDQIHLIVRTFGKLTTHHQELFHRNPVFSGVKLPECGSQPVALQQRFPTLTSAALHLAQSCLHMDPERRVHCSDLLDHLLFTHDSFNIRFLKELTAKIQKDQNQTSALPKITKTQRPEKDQGHEKNKKVKERKQLEVTSEKGNKNKEKTNRKDERVKFLKTPRNISEPLSTNKASKTPTRKVPEVKGGKAEKGKQGKLPCGWVKREPTDSEGTRAQSEPEVDNSTEPDHGVETSLKPRDACIKTTDQETRGSSSTASKEKDVMDMSFTSKSGPDLENCWTHTHLKVWSSSSNVGTSIKSSTAHQSDPSLICEGIGPSSRNHLEVPAVVTLSTSPPSPEHPNKQPPTGSQLTSELSEVFPSSYNSSKPTLNSGPESTKTVKPMSSGISSQSFTVCTQRPLGTSSLDLPNNGGLFQALSRTRPQQGHFEPEVYKLFKPSPARRERTFTPRPNHPGGDHQEDPESPELHNINQQSIFLSELFSESRTPSNLTLTETLEEKSSPGTRFPKTLQTSDKENREEFVFSESVTAVTKSSVAQTSKFSGIWSLRQNQRSSEVNCLSVTGPRDDDSQGKPSIAEPKQDHKSCSLVPLRSSPPPPPPPPSSTPLLLPPSSATLIHNKPVLSEHPRPVLQTGTISVRCVDQMKPHAVTCDRLIRPTLSLASKERSLTSQRSFLSDRCNVTVTRKKTDVHFPDLSGPSHQELRGRDAFPGRQRKGVTVETRKHKRPVPSVSPSERRPQRNHRRQVHTP